MKFFHQPPVWLYWDKPLDTMPPFLQFTLQTIMFHNPSCIILDNRAFRHMMRTAVGFDIEPGILLPEHESDILRAYLLATFGGIWLDVDYLCFKPFYSAVPTSEDFGFICYQRDDSYDNDIMAAPPGSMTAGAFWSEVRARVLYLNSMGDLGALKSGGVPRGHLGRDTLEHINRPGGMTRSSHFFDLNEVTPYRRMCMTLDEPCDLEFEPGSECYGMMLLNSLSGTYIDKSKTIDELVNSKTVLGAVFRAAERKMLY